ncbi:unnamed protein product [Rotaria socialis]|nr:unnamed protein product [Rotaria socialis]
MLCKRYVKYCLSSDTPTQMADLSTTPISEVQVGDAILALTPSGEIVQTVVRKVITHEVGDYLTFTFSNGIILRVGPDIPPTFVGLNTFNNVPMNVGNQVSVISGDGSNMSTVKITDIKAVKGVYTIMQRLNVDTPHTYFAGRVAVHNKFYMGSGVFGVSNDDNLQQLKLSEPTRRWRIVYPGLFFEAKCTNDECVAYDQEVIVNIGLKRFDFLVDVDKITCQCPCCSDWVNPHIAKCAFNRCEWRYSGKKQMGEQAPEEVFSSWNEVDDTSLRFHEQNSLSGIWKQLILEARECND